MSLAGCQGSIDFPDFQTWEVWDLPPIPITGNCDDFEHVFDNDPLHISVQGDFYVGNDRALFYLKNAFLNQVW